MADLQKIVPFLWFDNNAEEAVNFYISVFGNGKILSMSRHSEASAKASGMPEGSILVIAFELFGQKFQAINSGPAFHFTEAISFVVNCDTQEEIDTYWGKLSADPQAEQCGWLKDKFGLSWQIVPTVLNALVIDPDTKKSNAVLQAIMPMKKLDLAKLQEAYDKA